MTTPMPKFDITGGWVNAPFLADKIRQELMLHLGQAGLTNDQVERFLDSCNHIARIENGERQRIGADLVRKDLQGIAGNVRRLRNSIRKADPQAVDSQGIYIDEMAEKYLPALHHSYPVSDETDSQYHPFSKIWLFLELLELSANQAAGDLQPSRQAKPSQVNGLRLTTKVAKAYWLQCGNLPPANRASWFAGFMECLGSHLQMQCGPRIVATGIRAVKSRHVDR